MITSFLKIIVNPRKLDGKFPPCFQKERNKGGILHNGRFLIKFSTVFLIVQDLWRLKIFACGGYFHSFSCPYLRCSSRFHFQTTRSTCSSVQFRHTVGARSAKFFTIWDIEIAISKGESIEKLYQKAPQAKFLGILDIEIAFSKAKSIENCTKQAKFSRLRRPIGTPPQVLPPPCQTTSTHKGG